MLNETENVLVLSKQIRSLLVLCQNSSLVNMLQWIVGHPLLRAHQLSLAFFELTPEMNWRFVQGVGPVQFSEMSGVEDSFVCELRRSDKELPWGYFNWNAPIEHLAQNSNEISVTGLCLGAQDYSDGLLICASKKPFKFETFAPIYSFIRVASEFVYRHHYLHTSPEMKANSISNPEAVDSVELLERDSSMDGVVLTERQRKILESISAGLTNEEIASQMHLSLGTIRVETSRLYDRLGARNRQQAASLAHLVLDN